MSVFEENTRAIGSAASRIDKIVRSLKGFARLDEAEFQRTDLHRGIEETLTLLEPLYRGRVEIVREYGALPEVDCYAAELNQVFRVVLKNAIEAIEDRGTIRIVTGLRNSSLELRFSDTGRGMPEDVKNRLFQPSFRSTGTRVEARMGLFTAFSIVRKHGGDLRATSEVGKGSEFTIVLPLPAA
ncbi:MAG: HAMP domain-containing histidine kinase [Bryobacterales bacterium]|nr:HAMP domain-containing histidine kinase [Bryobacterales bacterium]